MLLPLAALLLALHGTTPAAAAEERRQRRLLAAPAAELECGIDCVPLGFSEPEFRACLSAVGAPPADGASSANDTSTARVVFSDEGPAADAARRWAWEARMGG